MTTTTTTRPRSPKKRPGPGSRSSGSTETSPSPGPSRRDEFSRGARAAAEIADGYNQVTAHDHRLGDCVLARLNLRADPPRRNRHRIDPPRDAWLRGFAEALDLVCRYLSPGAAAPGVRAAAAARGVTLGHLRDAGVPPSRVASLRRSGVPARPRVE